MTEQRAVKLCPGCGLFLSSSFFYKSAARNDGLSARCAPCTKEGARKRAAEYRARNGNVKKRWEENNRERSRANNKRHYKKWAQKNREKLAAKRSLERAYKTKAIPKWITEEHKKQILEVYTEARLMTDATGELHEVDHIHPLAGENFCGLHVPWNLRVIHYMENRTKRNIPAKDEAHLFFEAKWNITTKTYRDGSISPSPTLRLLKKQKTGQSSLSWGAGKGVQLLFWLLKLSTLGKTLTSTSWITGEGQMKRRIKLTLSWSLFSIFLRAMSPKVV